jgi:hypothetical protein
VDWKEENRIPDEERETLVEEDSHMMDLLLKSLKRF